MNASRVPDRRPSIRLSTTDLVFKQIKHALEFGEAIVSVIGQRGFGKSYLCQLLTLNLAENYFVVTLNSQVKTEAALHHAITSVLGSLEQDNFVSGLQNHLAQPEQQLKQLLIVVDDFHLCQPAIINALRILSNLQIESKRLIQFVFLGDQTINKILAQPEYFGFLQRVTHSLYINPLNKIQIQKSVVSSNLSFELSSDGASRLEKVSRGYPAVVAAVLAYFSKVEQPNSIFTKIDVNNAVEQDESTRKALTAIRSKYKRPILIGSGLAALLLLLVAFNMSNQQSVQEDPFADSNQTPDIELASTKKLAETSQTDSSNVKAKATNSSTTAHLNESKLSAEPFSAFDVTDEEIDHDNGNVTVEASTQERADTIVQLPSNEARELDTSTDSAIATSTVDETVIADKASISIDDAANHKQINAKAIEKALENWRAAWSSQNVAKYIESYTENYTMQDGRPRSQWIELRKKRLTAPEWIKISISDIEMQLKPNGIATTIFWMHYHSSSYQDRTKKQLVWVQVQEGWKISEETNLDLIEL